MKEVHIYSTAYIKPYLDKEIRVILTAPGDIRRTGIEVAPDHLIPSGGGVLPTQAPDRINGAFLYRIDHATDPQIVDCGIS